MPFYTCYSSKSALSPEQKQLIAEEITRIHVTRTGAPRSFVRVLFQEVAQDDLYTGGNVAESALIRGVIRAGRSPETKQQLLQDLWSLLQKVTGLGDEQLVVSVQENPAGNGMEYGEILPEPGAEEAWLARH